MYKLQWTIINVKCVLLLYTLKNAWHCGGVFENDHHRQRQSHSTLPSAYQIIITLKDTTVAYTI